MVSVTVPGALVVPTGVERLRLPGAAEIGANPVPIRGYDLRRVGKAVVNAEFAV